MLFKNITIIDENIEVKEKMYVGVKNDKIEYIGDEMPKDDFGQVYEGKNRLLMNAFFNCHTHLPMTLLRGYAENENLQNWLFNKIFPFEGQMNSDDVYYGALLGMAEMIRYGTVGATEMYFHMESIINAAIESGIKINVCNGTMSFDDKPLSENKNFNEELSLYKIYNNAENGRIKVDFSLHSEYTTKPLIVEQLAEFCRDLDANIHVHISETKLEVEECKQRHDGLTPVQYFNKLGLLENRVVGAHCVWLEDKDFDILSDKKFTVAHCPISNMKLASGVANVPKMLKGGINVAIGTDGVASNNNLNILEDMRVFSLIHKCVNYDPTLITCKQVLKSGSKSGAIAQNRQDCGSLKVGNKADLVVYNLSNPSMMPVHNLINNMVYSQDGSAVDLTMCDGKILYQSGEFKTIDIEKVYYETDKAKNRIIKQL